MDDSLKHRVRCVLAFLARHGTIVTSKDLTRYLELGNGAVARHAVYAYVSSLGFPLYRVAYRRSSTILIWEVPPSWRP